MRFDENAGEFGSESHKFACSSSQFYEKIDANREIRRPKKSGTRALYLFSDHRQRFVPPGSSNDNGDFALDARKDVVDSRFRFRELDCNIRVTQSAFRDSLSTAVVRRVEHRANRPSALLHHLRNGATHFSIADDRDLRLVLAHCSLLPKNSRCNRSIAASTSSPSTITVRLMPVALNDIMCTFVSPSAMSALPIAPPASQIPAPTIAIIPRFLSMERSPSERKSTSSASSLDGSSIVTETETSEVATTSTDV